MSLDALTSLPQAMIDFDSRKAETGDAETTSFPLAVTSPGQLKVHRPGKGRETKITATATKFKNKSGAGHAFSHRGARAEVVRSIENMRVLRHVPLYEAVGST